MNFRDLTANEIDVRIGQVGDGYCTLLLYKDARVDMDILDETVGCDNWQRKHYEVKGNLYCSVGVNTLDNGWVWKDDCGTESNTEKEKGESSDSFKRACVNWGIGRELYTSPLIKVECATYKNDKGKVVVKHLTNFTVKEIVIENKVITGLKITAWDKENRQEVVAFAWGKGKIANEKPVAKKVEQIDKEQLTYAQALNLSFNDKQGKKRFLKELDVVDLGRLLTNESPEFELLRAGAKLILEFKEQENA